MCEPITLTTAILAGSGLLSAGVGMYGAISAGNNQRDAMAAQTKEAQKQQDNLDRSLTNQAANAPKVQNTASSEDTQAATNAKLQSMRYGLASTIKTSPSGAPMAPVLAPVIGGAPAQGLILGAG